MRYLFDETKEINKKILKADKVFLFLDYDGTLVPIKSRPELAVFPLSTRKLLKKLSSSIKIYLSIVTGRSLKKIQRLIDIKEIIYVGNHGLEIKCKEKYWIHPTTSQTKSLIKKIASDIKKSTKQIPGILIEDKELIVGIHYRLVTEKSGGEIKDIISKIISPYGKMFCIGKGKKVYEIRPSIDWNKGKAILKVSELLGITDKSLKIYIGDDVTDEDAFKVLGKEEVSILVGHKKNSMAQYFCKSSSEVHKFLSNLSSTLDTIN